MSSPFTGLGVALITPFRANGAIDHAALAKVIEHQIIGGIDYLVVMGTTGESATITFEEKKQLLAQVIEVVHNRVPIVLGIGGNNTAEVIEQLGAFDLDGGRAAKGFARADRAHFQRCRSRGGRRHRDHRGVQPGAGRGVPHRRHRY